MTPLQVLGYVILALIAISLVSHYAVTRKAEKSRETMQAAWAKTSFTPQEVRLDIDTFQKTLKRVHPAPYHSLSKPEFERLFKELKDNIDHELSRIDVFCLLAAALTRFNDEHIQVHMPAAELDGPTGKPGILFPYAVLFLADRCYLQQGNEGEQALPGGTEILSINGVQIPEIIHHISSLFWGTCEKQRAYYASQYFGEGLYFAYRFEGRFDMLVKLPGENETRERRIAGKEYKKTQPTQPVPFSFRIDGRTLFFSYNAFEDPQGNFGSFLDGMFTDARQQGVERLIMDLRSNQGGTSSLGDRLLGYLTDQNFSQFDLVEIRSSPEVKHYFLSFLPGFLHWFVPLPYLHPMLSKLWRSKPGKMVELHFQPYKPFKNPLRFSGDLVVLIGPGTMSSASLLAATVQKYSLGVVVGAESGGYPTHYGNMIDIHLPSTGIKCMIPSSINHGNGTGPVVPDYPADQTLADLVDGKDTALEFAQFIPRRNQV